jgi:cell wall-associated NlpC family hydrolase
MKDLPGAMVKMIPPGMRRVLHSPARERRERRRNGRNDRADPGAGSGSGDSHVPEMPGDVEAGRQAEGAIARAESKLGARYVWATAGPETFDCSGFTYWVAEPIIGPLEYELRSSHHQFNVWGVPVPDGGVLLPGDLLFFDVGQGVIMGNRAGHVALHVGGGRFIHAANEELGVRYDDLSHDGWYWPRYIGARRIFDTQSEVGSRKSEDPEGAPGRKTEDGGRGTEGERPGRLRFPEGLIRTATPWNGQPFGVPWALVEVWGERIERACAAKGLDPRWLAVIITIETQGIHERDGEVLEVWDTHPEDGPSVGITQVKPRVWQWLCPECDATTVDGNIALGAAVLRYLIDEYGSFEAAIAKGYHPGRAPNGTTPEGYVKAARGLLEELADAA